MMRMCRKVSGSLLVAAALFLPAPADAQCPDGTPPPCRARTPAATPARSALALDDRTWIVVPFDNLAQSQEIDWLRAASVNLLYLDMSRWRDIRVVDDERVADLMREVPEARGASRLSLAAALAVARRAGAGRLVMGDLLKVGTRIAVVAKVFDVRGGRRLQSVREEASAQDSLIATFGRVARGILGVAPPSGENVGVIGTSSVAAYQEHLAGVHALNQFDLPEARRRFGRSLQFDSLFALPHYKMSVVIGWENLSDPQRQVHADAAVRLGNVLPPRERALVGALRKFSVGDFAGACVDYSALARADSGDVEALYGVGECAFHDESLEPIAGDSSRLQFRGSWNRSIRAFRRVLRLDPGNYLAFQHILDMLGAELRSGCVRAVADNACRGSAVDYTAVVRRDADTLVMVPAHTALETPAFAIQMDEAVRTNARKRNLEEARAMAEEWVAIAPHVARAHTSLGHVYVLLGRYTDAESQFRLATGDFPPAEAFGIFLDKLEIAIRRDRGAEALKLLDSAERAYEGKARPGNVTLGLALANAMVGRLAQFDSFASGMGIPPIISRYYYHAVRGMLTGVGTDSIVAMERAAFNLLAQSPMGRAQATSLISPSLLFGLRYPRESWPEIVVDPNDKSTLGGLALRPVVALARRDTQQLRQAARTLDSAAATPGGGVTHIIAGIIAFQSYMILRDSAAALRQLRRVLDTTFANVPITASLTQSGFGTGGVMWPRALLERADLAGALGFRDEARQSYRRFLDLWAGADPEFAPLIARVRKSYAAVGGT